MIKNVKPLIVVMFSLLYFTSCNVSTRQITESYIKTEIEDHIVGEQYYSSIHLIYQRALVDNSQDYVELAGYVGENEKKMIIAADKIYRLRMEYKGDRTLLQQVAFVELSEDECKAILKNNRSLLSEISKAETKSKKEEMYSDYTVNENMFVSFSKKRNSKIAYHIWLYGVKYNISSRTLNESIEEFLSL